MVDKKDDETNLSSQARREVLRKLGRFTVVTAPAVTLLLAAQTKPASAISSKCSALPQPSRRNLA